MLTTDFALSFREKEKYMVSCEFRVSMFGVSFNTHNTTPHSTLQCFWRRALLIFLLEIISCIANKQLSIYSNNTKLFLKIV